VSVVKESLLWKTEVENKLLALSGMETYTALVVEMTTYPKIPRPAPICHLSTRFQLLVPLNYRKLIGYVTI
jgi:hypothetical protein